MKKPAATLFLIGLLAVGVFGQAPTLTIKTETPGLPSELFYGSVKVKPVRLRPGTNTVITIADYDFFIQQNYIDFLKRFPEAGPDGVYGTADDPMKFYLDILNGCNSADLECIRYSRGAVSANFFRSPEFQRKGAYVVNLTNVTIGQRPKTAAELSDASKVERPTYTEFITDLTSISTPNDDPALTEQKKNALAADWVTRPEIQALYPAGLTNAQFASALAAKAGVTLSSSTQNAVNNATTRAQILRIIAESTEVVDKFYKPNFVTMEYFGYLRRNPEDCHNQANWDQGNPNNCGFIFHNNRFNLSPDKDFIENTIVRGFIESPEYIGRF
jgi:hypothetical protein